MKETVDVTIEGLIYSLSGFGEILRNIVLTLHEMGVYVRLIPHGGVHQGIPKKHVRIFNELKARYGGPRKDSIFLYFGTPLGCAKYHETYCISWTMFETQDTPYDFVRHLSPMDEVWLPSNFCHESFTRAGLAREKTRVMPLGVDTAVFTPKPVGLGPASKIFKFGTVVGWSERKGVSAMLQSYLREFDRGKDKALFIIRGGYYPKDKIMAEIDLAKREASKWMPREKQCDIYLCYHIVPVDRMPDLYRMFDCLVYGSLGEGQCLPAMEAMSSGVPCIITRATAPLDFCTDENSYLIDVEKIDRNPKCEWITAYYKYPFPNEQSRGATFAYPSQEHLQKLMRHAYEHRDEVRKKGEKARADVCQKWDIRLICERVKRRLLEIQEMRKIYPVYQESLQAGRMIRENHPGETMTKISMDGKGRTIVG